MSQANLDAFEKANDAFMRGDWDAIAATMDAHILVRADPRWPEQRFYGRRMKIKGAGATFRSLFAAISAIGSVAVVARRAGDRLVWSGFGSGTAQRAQCEGFCAREGGRPCWHRACRRSCDVGLLVWARADDVAKRRRQGLVVCRAASPFMGFFDARPGVTLAPTFSAWVACQSRTVRA
jgi:hypothetical protein